jgi:phenylacetate-CoA ligase
MSVEDRLHRFLAMYMASPQWLKSGVGQAYSVLPVGLRRGRAYARFRDALQGETHGEYARTQLAHTLQWAVRTVPAYEGFASVEECRQDPVAALARFPLLSKEVFKQAPARYLSAAMPAQARLKTFTGGSTATPLMLYLHKGVTRSREYAFMDDFHARVGLNDKHVVLALRGRSVPGAGKPGGRLWMFEPIRRQLILSSNHLEPEYMPQYVDALRRWQPAYIQAFPSALYPLARWLAAHPAPDVTVGVRGVLLYSESVYGYQMDLFRKVFSCPVLQHYGHSERVLMAATMPDDDRYFFWPQYGHFELVDAAGKPITAPGVLGEIVGTSFDNPVMPLVRYRTADMAMLSARPGHPLLPECVAVERIEGRLQEFLVCRDRRLVSICTMGAAHFSELAEVETIQYEQREPGHFMLKVVARKPLAGAVRQRIVQAMQEKTQGGCTAEVREVEKIERTARGKHRMLIQHLEISHYLGASVELEA